MRKDKILSHDLMSLKWLMVWTNRTKMYGEFSALHLRLLTAKQEDHLKTWVGVALHPGCLDTIVTKRAHGGHGRPVPVRHMGDQSLAAVSPAAQRRHVGLDPGFVDEDKAARVDPVAIRDPSPAPSCDVRPDLFGGQNGFF